MSCIIVIANAIMSTFQVPYSSSPPTPSTPNFSARQNGNDGLSNYFPAHPYTTPAGPAPSSVGSFTPTDSTPSRLGTSQLGSGRTLFKGKSSSRSIPRSQESVNSATKSSKLERQLDRSSRFDISSNHHRTKDDGLEIPLYGEYEEEEGNNSHEDYEFNSHNYRDTTSHQYRPTSSEEGYSVHTSDHAYSDQGLQSLDSSLLVASPRGVKRSRGISTLAIGSPTISRASKLRKESAIPRIAAKMARQMRAAPLTEEDSFILITENSLGSMYAEQDDDGTSQQDKELSLANTSQQLCDLWIRYSTQHKKSSEREEDITYCIGPREEEQSFLRATFIGTLLLPLHHPPNARGKQALAPTHFESSSFARSSLPQRPLINPTAIPKVLLDWLDRHHNPWGKALAEVETRYPSPPAHYNFWDMIFVLILRGKIQHAIQLLEKSDFHASETAPKDGEIDGYTDLQINNVQKVVNKAVEVLQRCPAITDEDWNVTGNDWTIFRKLVERAMADLTKFAEGRDEDPELENEMLDTSRFGLDGANLSHSRVSRRAESRVPWSVYQSLKAMYGILLGGDSEVIAFAQDWVEATIGLTVWWTGDSLEDLSVGSVARTKRSLLRSQTEARRLVDVDNKTAYLDRLAHSFKRATDDSGEDDFQINSNNPVEVGLASVFEGNFEGVVGLLRAWSLPVASAVAEIATFGGWFDRSPAAANTIMDAFDQSDLMVLSSYGEPEKLVQRDTIIIEYANALLTRHTLREEREVKQKALEGWQLSIALLVRLGDDKLSKLEIGKALRQVYVDTDERVDMILRICQEYGMEEVGHHIAEVRVMPFDSRYS